jgi:hypothetical protein
MFLVIESPKFLLTKKSKRDEEAFEILTKLLPEGEKHIISSEMKRKISLQYALYMQSSNSSSKKRNGYMDLFNPTNIKSSLILFTLWYIVSYVYYGLIYILPSIYENILMKENHNRKLDDKMYEKIVADIIISCVFEFPSNLANGILPNLIGRKWSLIFGFLGSFIFSVLSLFSLNSIPLYSALSKAFINIAFSVLYVYTSEVYPTYMRVTGLGTCNFFSRLGGFTTPFLNEFLYRIKNVLPFMGFSLASFLGIILTIFLEETQGKTTY